MALIGWHYGFAFYNYETVIIELVAIVYVSGATGVDSCSCAMLFIDAFFLVYYVTNLILITKTQ